MSPSSPFIMKLGDAELPSDLDFHFLFGYGGADLLGSRANDGTLPVASQLDPRFRYYQSNANWSPNLPAIRVSRRELTPLGQRGGPVLLECFAGDEVTFEVEVIVD